MAIEWNNVREGASEEDELWSVFHENSKTSRWVAGKSNEEVLAQMAQVWDSLPYEGYENTALPTTMAPVKVPLWEGLTSRTTARKLTPGPVTMEQLGTLLHCAYGVSRDNADGTYPRPFRTVPSGGALYPLEIYFHSAYVDGLAPGLYHFNPRERCVTALRRGDGSRQIGQALVDSHLALDSSIVVFITAMFERSVFKYGNRGYRFVLLEAGHVAQNLNLAATALGLGIINIGGYADHEMDRFLGLDGVRQSTVYVAAIGGKADGAQGENG